MKKKYILSILCIAVSTAVILTTGIKRNDYYDVLDDIADIDEELGDDLEEINDEESVNDETVITEYIEEDEDEIDGTFLQDSDYIDERPEYDPLEYVDLTKVDFDEIEKLKTSYVSELDIDEVILNQMIEKEVYSETDIAKSGDMVNISYTVTFKGEEEPYIDISSENRIIGQNNFPEKIDEMLVGTKKSDIIDLDYDYPDDFDDESYKGKECTYHIVINHIYDMSFTDETARIVSGWQDVTADEYKEWLSEALFYKSYEYLEALYDMCEVVSYPEDVFEYDIQSKFVEVYQAASEYSEKDIVSVEDEEFVGYLQSIGYKDVDDFINQLQIEEEENLTEEIKRLALNQQYGLDMESLS